MTYGVDQCRVCGKPIQVLRPAAMAEWEQAQRKPIMPEKQWRARGYLAAPTARQLHTSPADGCCSECGMRQMAIKWRYSRRGLTLIGALLALFVVVSAIIIYLPH